MYTNNPAYKLEVQTETVRIFTPVQTTEMYSTQRYVEAVNQQIYSNAGATRDTLDEVMKAMIAICNDEKEREWRTKIGALAQSIQYRLSHPVDQHCAVRMGCILSFMEEVKQEQNLIQKNFGTDEVPDYRLILNPENPYIESVISEPEKTIDQVWLEKKMNLAFSDDTYYRFFLTWGILNTPKYNEALDTLNDMEYFVKRMQVIQSVTKNLINPYKK